ncbi:flagellar assembly protein T N-terminal domain-containing protein [Thiomicrorhabdus indica]|uniref:flagellar assembly protein T N-terminal domain-containing protein n=1 Tax=Thiomicrorhabdus indica TaxID=2267253 RepID=UPI00102D8947|nr:flagellar assembly protein T N-terminal domain-containing protein [Thiomicrorhabdus indica]
MANSKLSSKAVFSSENTIRKLIFVMGLFVLMVPFITQAQDDVLFGDVEPQTGQNLGLDKVFDLPALENSKQSLPAGKNNCPEGSLYNPQQNRCVIHVVKQSIPSECVTVKGIAPIDNGNEDFAQKMAIREAIKNATMRRNLNVRTDQKMENYEITLDSSRFTSQARVESFRILEEGLEDPMDLYGQDKKEPLGYEVTLEVCLTDDPKVCPNLEGHQYQTRLAVAPVVMENAYEARDISNLVIGYQKEVERRLLQQGHLNLIGLDYTVEIQPNQKITPNLDERLLTDVRNQTGAQYLLLSVLKSASAHEEDNGFMNRVKRTYNLQVDKDSRYIEVDWYLVDLINFRTVSEARDGFDIKGDVRVGRDRPFGTNAFFATDVGKAFHALLKEQTRKVYEAVRCQPFESEVIEKRGDQYLVLMDQRSGVEVGDVLAVYQRQDRQVRFNGRTLGYDLTPGAFLTVKRVMDQFVIAELSASQEVVQIGDRVKAW